jgi:thymidylate synthase
MIENKFELRYRHLLMDAMLKGTHRDDRTGVGCRSIFGKSVEFDTKHGKYWPLVTGKKMYKYIWDTEFEWFISGDTTNKILEKNDVTIWREWMTMQDEDGTPSIGKGYGYQLRKWNGNIDQLERVIESIQNTPDSRRHLVSLWNPADLEETTLPPCHYSFQFFVNHTEDQLDILVNMRSVDLFLGLPYDFMLYFKMLEYVAKRTKNNMGKMIFMLGDTHVYDNHHLAVKKYLMQPIRHINMTGFTYEAAVIKADIAI